MSSMVNPDSISRYEHPMDQIEEEEEFITCETCQWWVRCSQRDGSAVVSMINPYSRVYRNDYDKRAVAKAVTRCGICARRTELRAATDPMCGDDYDERVG